MLARRLATGTGPWRVLIDAEGLIADAEQPGRPCMSRPRLASRYVTLSEAAKASGVTLRAVREWCRTGRVVCRRLAGGKGPWRVLLDRDGLPADADSVSKPQLPDMVAA